MGRILVAGIGNIFLGDDAFGVEVVQQFMKGQLSANVDVIDFGIRGFDLAYALMKPYDAVILVDALQRGEAPGTLYTLEPDLTALKDQAREEMTLDTHGMHPMKVLALVKRMGGEPKQLYVLGCEPESSEDERIGLSPAVALAVGEAVAMLHSLIAKIAAAHRAVAAS